MSKFNIKTGQVSAVTGSYTEVTSLGIIENAFGVFPALEAIYLSIGHSTAADATSILVPAGGAWGVEFGIVGPIFVKSVDTASTVYLYGA